MKTVTEKQMDEKEENCAGAIPEVVFSAVLSRMNQLEHEIEERDMEYKALSEFILRHEAAMEEPIR